ncbi:NTP transferase domain-containing protein [Trueperella sp. LYQ143]|uniref:NTP transferase domain-containing protein n=1 Tax=unclassified Trueperella TaxID=2630174 RepID=UPI0039838800
MGELTAAIVLAAGKGTRIKSQIPKVLLPMNGRSVLQHVNSAVIGAGAEYVVYVVRHEREKVAAHIAQMNPEALIADQDDIKGTGRAAWCGLAALPEGLTGSVLVVAGDSPMFTPQVLQELAGVHAQGNNAVTVLSTYVADPSGYGRIVRKAAGPDQRDERAGATGEILAIVEDRDLLDDQRDITEIATSTYVFDIAFLRDSLQTLGTDNAQGEMYLTDVVQRARELGQGVGSFVLDDSVQAEGLNDLVQLANLRAEKNRRIVAAWMRQGVFVVDPERTIIESDVTLEPDAVIEPGSILRGRTHVAAFAVVGPYTELTDVHVGARAHVPHCVAQGVELSADECVPPFSVLGSSLAMKAPDSLSGAIG